MSTPAHIDALTLAVICVAFVLFSMAVGPQNEKVAALLVASGAAGASVAILLVGAFS